MSSTTGSPTVPACSITADLTGSLDERRAVDCGYESESPGDWETHTDVPTAHTYCRTPWIKVHKRVPEICKANPCEVISGTKMQRESLYRAGGSFPLDFTIAYDSKFALTYASTSDPSSREIRNPVGIGWHSRYFQALQVMVPPSGSIEVQARRADNKYIFFRQVSTGFAPEGDVTEQLTRLTDSGGNTTGWRLVTPSDEVESYDPNGRLLSIASRSGIVHTLAYANSAEIYPTSVADSFGNQIGFTYDTAPAPHVSIVTLPDGSHIGLGYDSAGRLTTVTFPDATTRTYWYEQTATAAVDLLTGITDEANVRFATWAYDTSGRVTDSQHAGGVEHYTFTYNADDSRTVLTPLGESCKYGSAVIWGTRRSIGLLATGGVYVPCDTPGEPGSLAYDANGNVSTRVDRNNNQSTYTYDLTRNLETSRTEAYGTARARTITTTWESAWREPDLITEPNRTTAFTYDTSGNALTKSVTDTSVTPNVVRTWTYTYDGYGHVLTADGPRTDVSDLTTYTYYTCTTGYQCGQVHTVTNAAGQTVTYNTYNAHSQPLTITDPNGVVTTLTYDARQRLTSRQTASETTAFDYWPTGLLKKVTLPDASYVLYTYDAAHRLTQISDALGNKIVYTLDGMGNRTAENGYDPTNALHRTHTRVFNAVNQLFKDVNAAGTAAVTTTFGYDNQGNQTSMAAPLSRTTANTYDELNRLKQITDPGSGITQFGYDANDNLTSVIDPRNLTTTYTYTGFGDLKTQVSPDTGTTLNTYDSGGNLSTSTDARGALSTYTYDALNRVISAAYSLGGTTDQTLSFTYDTGTNGLGHLTGASDATHSMSWTYDALGRVTSKGQVIGGVTRSVGYGYSSGNLTSLTTPSGQAVAYGYNANHQVTSVLVNGTTVLNSVSYEPLGPISGWSWGNSTTTTRTYDADGKISQIVSAGTKTYTYDDAFRITGITDTSTGAATWTYGYDSLDRITSGVSSSLTRGWSYDANGNRLTESGAAPSTYAISGTSNRINGITGALARTYTYDVAGNTTGYSTVTATYNNAGRLKTLTQGGTTETSVYNALGQRVKISGGTAGTVLYAYDEAGHLLGEYDATGALIEETVWLGDIPVATLRPNGASVAIYYIHSDQLNTPRQVTRPSDNAQMWTWFSDPFGTDAANANPAGTGAFAYNLRFPGQVFDGQAGLHQNGFRDFDPATGRYAESDPMGLYGASWSTYAYADGNPISSIDPRGLMGRGGMRTRPSPIPPGGLRFGGGASGCGCQRWPDYISFQIDLYVISFSGTYTQYGDVFFGTGASRQYWNPASTGVSISDGWLLKCNPTVDDINNFLVGWSASAGGYLGVGGTYSRNTSGSAINIGVGAGSAKASASPGIINTYQGNLFGPPWQPQ